MVLCVCVDLKIIVGYEIMHIASLSCFISQIYLQGSCSRQACGSCIQRLSLGSPQRQPRLLSAREREHGRAQNRNKPALQKQPGKLAGHFKHKDLQILTFAPFYRQSRKTSFSNTTESLTYHF